MRAYRPVGVQIPWQREENTAPVARCSREGILQGDGVLCDSWLADALECTWPLTHSSHLLLRLTFLFHRSSIDSLQGSRHAVVEKAETQNMSVVVETKKESVETPPPPSPEGNARSFPKRI